MQTELESAVQVFDSFFPLMTYNRLRSVRYYWYLAMVSILDGDLEIGAHVRSNHGYLICLMHLFRSRADTNLIFLEVLFSYTRKQRVLSYHLIEEPWIL